MENVFSTLTEWGGKWNKVSERTFNDQEKAAVKSATVVSHVVEGKTLQSVCFSMSNGKFTYIPLSAFTVASDGDVVDINKCKLVTLHRDGDGDRLRVEF